MVIQKKQPEAAYIPTVFQADTFLEAVILEAVFAKAGFPEIYNYIIRNYPAIDVTQQDARVIVQHAYDVLTKLNKKDQK